MSSRSKDVDKEEERKQEFGARCDNILLNDQTAVNVFSAKVETPKKKPSPLEVNSESQGEEDDIVGGLGDLENVLPKAPMLGMKKTTSIIPEKPTVSKPLTVQTKAPL